MKMRYTLRSKRGAMAYSRTLPDDVQGVAGKRTWTRGMGVNERDSHASIQSAWAACHADCEALIEYWRNTGGEVIEDQRLDELAAAVLRQHGLDVGALAKAGEVAEIVLQHRIPDFGSPENEGSEREVLHVRMHALATHQRKLPTYLSDCWALYAKHKAIDTDTRVGKRIASRWKQWLVVAGDHVLTKDAVEAGLDRWRDLRVEQGVSSASIKRELTTIAAVVRHTSRSLRLGLSVELPMLPKHTAKVRPCLEQETQRELVRCVTAIPVTTKRTDRKHIADGAALLLMLQGAMITSECMRLPRAKLALDAGVPHIVIDGQTKTNARKRIVPLTVGLPWLRRAFAALADDSELAFGAEWAALTESALSKRLERVLRGYGEGFTSYSLRHTFKANAMAAGAGTNAAVIAGWSSQGGISTIMFGYGQDGLSQTAVLQGIETTSREINHHLLGIGVEGVVSIANEKVGIAS